MSKPILFLASLLCFSPGAPAGAGLVGKWAISGARCATGKYKGLKVGSPRAGVVTLEISSLQIVYRLSTPVRNREPDSTGLVRKLEDAVAQARGFPDSPEKAELIKKGEDLIEWDRKYREGTRCEFSRTYGYAATKTKIIAGPITGVENSCPFLEDEPSKVEGFDGEFVLRGDRLRILGPVVEDEDAICPIKDRIEVTFRRVK